MPRFWLIQSLLNDPSLPYADTHEWIVEDDDQPPDREYDMNGGVTEQIICLGGPYESYWEAVDVLLALYRWSEGYE